MNESNFTTDCRALYEQLKAKYRLKQVHLEIEAHPLKLIKVENIDDLLDQVTDPDEIPFWAELWPASIGLATAILRNEALFRRKKVLELGAGVGLAGIAATLAGSQVTHSDFMKDAFDFIKVNSWFNGLPANPTLLADWRDFPEQTAPFDLVIGADILYEKTFHHHLAEVLRRVTAPGGLIWLADPGRKYGQEFCQKKAEAGWRVHQTQIAVNYQETAYTIDLYQMALPGTL